MKPAWEVSTRSRGEVLTASSSAPGLQLVLLGVPPSFTPNEIEGWLHDVAGVAIETATLDTASKPIPSVLHHALTGMLFSHAEVWSQPGSPAPCSIALVRHGGEVGLGWVGDARVSVPRVRPLEVAGDCQ